MSGSASFSIKEKGKLILAIFVICCVLYFVISSKLSYMVITNQLFTEFQQVLIQESVNMVEV